MVCYPFKFYKGCLPQNLLEETTNDNNLFAVAWRKVIGNYDSIAECHR